MSETETALVEAKPTLTEILAAEANLDRDTYYATIKKTAMPANTSNEHIAAFLTLAYDMGLNPLSDEAHAFPSKGGVKLMVGVDGWVTIANKKKNYDGWEHQDNFDDKGNLVSVTAIIRRADHSSPTKITEYMDECKGDSAPWKKFPKRMLRHKAFSQGVRMAFGISNVLDEDEASDMGYDKATRTVKDITPDGETESDPLQLAAAQTEDTVTISKAAEPEPTFEDELEEAKISKTVETKKGPVTMEVDALGPMDIAIKKIEGYESARNLESYIKTKKTLVWPSQFSESEVKSLIKIGEEKLLELKRAF